MLAKQENTEVVVLIDEYDKPILDLIDNTEHATINREISKGSLWGFKR